MKKLVLAAMLLPLLTGCKKHDDDHPTTPNTPNYTPMKVGNYWVYEVYKYEAATSTYSLVGEDSVVITGTSTIGPNTYYAFEGNKLIANPDRVTSFYRDSSGYIVDKYGTILFTPQNNFQTLHTIIYAAADSLKFESAMQPGLKPIQVPAGNYQCKNYLNTLTYNTPVSGIPQVRYFDNLYANGIGKVYFEYTYASQPDHFEERLVRYKIN